MWGHGVLPTALPAPFSYTLSPALSVYPRECGATGFASAWTACTVCPTLLQSWSPVSVPLVPPRQCESSLPRLLSPPLLPVWMNVSSLSPWMLDFHTVQFSGSSGWFLFLNCCPSFGCAGRYSVSTYASILARSPTTLNLKCRDLGSHLLSTIY